MTEGSEQIEQSDLQNKPAEQRGGYALLHLFYLLTGIASLIITVEGIAEDLGLITAPAEQSLPYLIYLLVTIATFIAMITLILGIPIAIYVFLNFGDIKKLVTPAVLLSGAVVFISSYIASGSQIDILLWIGGTLLFFYGCASTIIAIQHYR